MTDMTWMFCVPFTMQIFLSFVGGNQNHLKKGQILSNLAHPSNLLFSYKYLMLMVTLGLSKTVRFYGF
jgi:hypothetical protein